MSSFDLRDTIRFYSKEFDGLKFYIYKHQIHWYNWSIRLETGYGGGELPLPLTGYTPTLPPTQQKWKLSQVSLPLLTWG